MRIYDTGNVRSLQNSYDIFAATSIADLVTLAMSENLTELFASKITAWLSAYCALSIMTQVSASCLIAYKIWGSQRKFTSLKSTQPSRTMSVLWIILESGAMLSIMMVGSLGGRGLKTVSVISLSLQLSGSGTPGDSKRINGGRSKQMDWNLLL